jgi:hypothetical protein
MRLRRPTGAVTYAEARAAVRYDPITGKFWSLKTGEEVGYVNCQKSRYITVEVSGARVRANRLAWLLMTGEWPRWTVDHIDHNRQNNCWLNLRDVTILTNVRGRTKRNKALGGTEYGRVAFGLFADVAAKAEA